MTATPDTRHETRRRHRVPQLWRDDRGQTVGPELLVLLVLALVVWGGLSWFGRLAQTSQSLENAAQTAARTASQRDDIDTARTAAEAAIAASPVAGCIDAPTVQLTWEPGPTGTWRGGTVTATVECTIDNTEPFTSDGRTVRAVDTQVIDRFAG